MQKKVLFGFDYTDNEFVKIILYLFVGGRALAYFLSTLYHYFMCNILVFTSGVRYGRAKELSLVFLVSGMGLLFNLLLMYLFVGMFGMPGLVSKIAATCIVVVWNYLARKKWIF